MANAMSNKTKEYEVVQFELGKETYVYSWLQNYQILTYCGYFPDRKVGGQMHCQSCKFHKGIVDNRETKELYVKCTFKYGLQYKLRKLFNKV